MASPLSKSSFPSFHNDEEVKERPLSKVKPTQRPGSSGTKGRPTSASRALKNANQAYGGGPSVGKAAGLDSAQNDVLLSSMTREELVGALFEAKRRVKSLESSTTHLKADAVKCENELAKQHRRIEKLLDSTAAQSVNGANRQTAQAPPITIDARKELEKTVLVRQMKTQMMLLRTSLAEREVEVETLKKSQKGTKIVELSNEKEEFYLETLRLKQVVRELRESLQNERQKRAWDKKKNGAGEDIRKEVARLTSGYQNILKGIAPSQKGENRPVNASLSNNPYIGSNTNFNSISNSNINNSSNNNLNNSQNSKRPQSAAKNRPPPLVVNASNATTLFHMPNASGSSLMNSPKNEPRVTEPVKLSKQQLSRRGRETADTDTDDVDRATVDELDFFADVNEGGNDVSFNANGEDGRIDGRNGRKDDYNDYSEFQTHSNNNDHNDHNSNDNDIDDNNLGFESDINYSNNISNNNYINKNVNFNDTVDNDNDNNNNNDNINGHNNYSNDIDEKGNMSEGISVFVSKITTSNLSNVERKDGDRNDVFVMLSFDDIWDTNTGTVWEGGSEVSWTFSPSDAKHKNMQWYTSLDRLRGGYFSVSEMDENEKSASKIIGEGKTRIMLPSLFGNESMALLDTESAVTLEIFLKNKIGHNSGSVSVTLNLLSVPLMPDMMGENVEIDYEGEMEGEGENNDNNNHNNNGINGANGNGYHVSKFNIGDSVEGQYKGGGSWYSATIKGINKENNIFTYHLLYDDGDEEKDMLEIKIKLINPAPKKQEKSEKIGKPDPKNKSEIIEKIPTSVLVPSKKSQGDIYSVGDNVEALFERGDEWYKAKVKGLNQKGNYDLYYEDGDEEDDVSIGRMRGLKIITTPTHSSATPQHTASTINTAHTANSVTSHATIQSEVERTEHEREVREQRDMNNSEHPHPTHNTHNTHKSSEKNEQLNETTESNHTSSRKLSVKSSEDAFLDNYLDELSDDDDPSGPLGGLGGLNSGPGVYGNIPHSEGDTDNGHDNGDNYDNNGHNGHDNGSGKYDNGSGKSDDIPSAKNYSVDDDENGVGRVGGKGDMRGHTIKGDKPVTGKEEADEAGDYEEDFDA